MIQYIANFLICLLLKYLFLACVASTHRHIGHANVKFRCFVPECDDPNNPNYNESWVSTVVPGQTDSTGLFSPEQCVRYEIPNTGGNSSSYVCGRDLPHKNEMRCNRWVFDNYEKTIVEEWSITCKENQYLLALVGTSHFAGIVAGSAAAGLLADR